MAEIKKNRRGLSLRFLVVIRCMHLKQADFCMCNGLANFIAKVVCYTYR